ncbi:MAG: cobalt ECF transporter T component CbiQ [Stenomitos rutilans HA7619-LM2]|jgi:cobalt/nickel transport system permease protein|nr:cobalt ECF transporter T component CbiQ [Stenomitos rutilans HA7619-LM2]
MLLHIGAFHLAVDSQQTSPWHRLAPKTRVLCTLLLLFAIALTPNGRWWTWAIYAVGVGAIVLSSRATLPILFKRVAIESVFIGVVLLGTLFRGGGVVLWHWGWLQITTEGLWVLGSVTIKALLSLLLANVLVLTTAVPELLHALTVLRVPPLLVAILASMYRYIAVLVGEFQSMQRAALSRNLMGSQRWQRLVVGNMFGSLFIRTLERGERVHQAMVSRGYEGLPPVATAPTGHRRDVVALTLTAVLTLLGQGIYLFSVV